MKKKKDLKNSCSLKLPAEAVNKNLGKKGRKPSNLSKNKLHIFFFKDIFLSWLF